MSPERKAIIGEHKVEEYYWAGKMVVYVDNHLVNTETFDEACRRVTKVQHKEGE